MSQIARFSQRVYLKTATVGLNFATCGQVRKHHPGCADHGDLLHETEARPYGFVTAALNAACDFATNRGWTVVDEDYEP